MQFAIRSSVFQPPSFKGRFRVPLLPLMENGCLLKVLSVSFFAALVRLIIVITCGILVIGYLVRQEFQSKYGFRGLSVPHFTNELRLSACFLLSSALGPRKLEAKLYFTAQTFGVSDFMTVAPLMIRLKWTDLERPESVSVVANSIYIECIANLFHSRDYHHRAHAYQTI